MSMFGWSYPAGAANDPFAPYNQEAEPCEVCGRGELDCICLECPVCGSAGDGRCYVDHGMRRNRAQIEGAVDLAVAYEKQREADEAEAAYWREQQQKLKDNTDDQRNITIFGEW